MKWDLILVLYLSVLSFVAMTVAAYLAIKMEFWVMSVLWVFLLPLYVGPAIHFIQELRK